MGITGLLPLLKPVTKDMHISELKGLTVGIDTYCWLHKGIYSCSAELCQGIPTDKFIKYCVERVHLLLSHGVKPYLVFDGGYLPAKAGKEEERRAKRESNLQRGLQLMREGNASGAHQFFCKAADVTPFMAHQVIQVIKRIPGVRHVVAPYEADAQLGFLARNGHVDAVITEDSDIMLFGCTRVVFKLDRDGTGQEVDLKEVFSTRNDELDMRGMNEDDLMTLCALSGCDYLPSVHGMGLKKAYRMVSRHKELSKILRAVKFDSGGNFPLGYEADFQRALLTFRHQRAFDPVSRRVVHMTPLPESLPSAITATPVESGGGEAAVAERLAALAFLGPPVAQEKGCAVADGDVDPITGKAFSEMGADGVVGDDGVKTPESALTEVAAAALAAWRGTSMPAPGGGGSAAGKKKLSAQGNNLTKYWGTPLSSSKKSRAKGNDGDGGGGSDGACVARAVDRSFEFGATPDRPSRGTTGSVASASEKRLDTDRPSPARTPSCVSPGSFYAGVSPSPPRRHAPGEVVDPLEDKENRDPLSLLDRPPSDGAGDDDSPARSKFFGGSAGGNGGDGSGTQAAPVAGLRRRFSPPLAAGRSSNVRSATSSGASLRRARGGEEKADPSGDDRDTDPWRADFAYPRLDVPRHATAAGNGKGVGGAAGAGRGGGGRLKRRRTLGVGSVAPGGLMRGLEGSAGRGPGRRSKSLEGVPGGASPRSGDSPDAFDGDGDDSAATAADDGGGADGCINNLFERFAARPRRQQLHRPPTRTAPPAVYDDGQPAAAATTRTEEVLAQAAAAAAPGVSCSGATGKTTPTSANENRRGSATTTANANAAATFPSTGADGTGADDDARERETTLGDAATSDEEAGASGGGAHSPVSLVEKEDSRTRSLHPLAAAAVPLLSTSATLTRKPSEEGGCAAGQAADVRGRGCRGRPQTGLVGGDSGGARCSAVHSEKACFAGGNVRKKSSCLRGSEDGSGKQRGSGGQLREASLDTGDDAVMLDVFAKFVYSPS